MIAKKYRHLYPWNSPSIQNIYFALMFSLQLQRLRLGKPCFKDSFNLFLWQSSQTACLEAIYLQSQGGGEPATLYNSLSSSWLPLGQSISSSGSALHLAIHTIKRFSAKKKKKGRPHNLASPRTLIFEKSKWVQLLPEFNSKAVTFCTDESPAC